MEMKQHFQLVQIIRQINATQIQGLIKILTGKLNNLRRYCREANHPSSTDADENPDHLRTQYAPYNRGLPMGDVLTCCLSVFRTL